MNSFGWDDLEGLCRLRLDAFLSENGQNSLPLPYEAGLSEIVEIINKNLKVGRLARQNAYRAPSGQLTPETYVDRVISLWSKYQPVWCCLRSHDPATWRWLEQDLTRAADWMLFKHPGLGSAASTTDDFVQRTCIKIFRSHYHFDMPLLVWARTILGNTIREPNRSPDALDQWHLSLDVPFTSGTAGVQNVVQDTYADSASERRFEQIREREALLKTLSKLTTIRQAILILTYFDELTDHEIAKKLEISISNLHSTRHRALKQLCRLMEEQPMQE